MSKHVAATLTRSIPGYIRLNKRLKREKPHKIERTYTDWVERKPIECMKRPAQEGHEKRKREEKDRANRKATKSAKT